MCVWGGGTDGQGAVWDGWMDGWTERRTACRGGWTKCGVWDRHPAWTDGRHRDGQTRGVEHSVPVHCSSSQLLDVLKPLTPPQDTSSSTPHTITPLSPACSSSLATATTPQSHSPSLAITCCMFVPPLPQFPQSHVWALLCPLPSVSPHCPLRFAPIPMEVCPTGPTELQEQAVGTRPPRCGAGQCGDRFWGVCRDQPQLMAQRWGALTPG